MRDFTAKFITHLQKSLYLQFSHKQGKAVVLLGSSCMEGMFSQFQSDHGQDELCCFYSFGSNCS